MMTGYDDWAAVPVGSLLRTRDERMYVNLRVFLGVTSMLLNDDRPMGLVVDDLGTQVLQLVSIDAYEMVSDASLVTG